MSSSRKFFSTLQRLRANYKQRIQQIFQEIATSLIFVNFKSAAHLSRFKFVVATAAYKDQIVSLVTNRYSFQGKYSPGIVFHLTQFDTQALFEAKVEHLISTGRLLIAIDESNAVIGTHGLLDLCDHQYANAELVAKYPQNVKDMNKCKKTELLKYQRQNEEFRKIVHSDLSADELQLLYGKWCEGTVYCVRMDAAHSGVMFALAQLATWVVLRLGYQYELGRTNSDRISQWSDHDHDIFPCYEDSQKLVHLCVISGIDIELYFKALEVKYGYSNDYVERLRATVSYHTHIWHFTKYHHGTCDQFIQNRFKEYLVIVSQRSKSKSKL